MKSKYTYKDGLVDGMPIAFGYLTVSIGFGIAAVNKGIPAIAALLISMTNLTSAGQVAGADLIAAGGLITEMIAVQLTINCRYALMGISLTQKLDNSFNTFQRLITGAFITDEIFSVALLKTGKINTAYFYGLATAPYIGWALGTAIGAYGGSILPDNLRLSLGIAIYGMFIAIVVPAAKSDKGAGIAALTAGALSCILYFVPLFDFISDGFSLIICAVAGAVVAAAVHPVDDKDEEALYD